MQAVVFGFDPEWTMSKSCIASLYINEQKAKLFVTNPDRFANVQGRTFPGCFTQVEALLVTLKDRSYVVPGKPNTFAIEKLLK